MQLSHSLLIPFWRAGSMELEWPDELPFTSSAVSNNNQGAFGHTSLLSLCKRADWYFKASTDLLQISIFLCDKNLMFKYHSLHHTIQHTESEHIGFFSSLLSLGLSSIGGVILRFSATAVSGSKAGDVEVTLFNDCSSFLRLITVWVSAFCKR